MKQGSKKQKTTPHNDTMNRMNNAQADIYHTIVKLVQWSDMSELTDITKEGYYKVDFSVTHPTLKNWGDKPVKGIIFNMNLNRRTEIVDRLYQLLDNDTTLYFKSKLVDKILSFCELYHIVKEARTRQDVTEAKKILKSVRDQIKKQWVLTGECNSINF